LNEIHQQPYGLKIGEWTKIFRSVLLDFTRGKHPWERFFFNTNPGVGFIVTQQNIVARLMFFDQGVFQDQRIGFGGHYDMFDQKDVFDQSLGFSRIDLLSKIGRHPIF
jgi:hypothetical protein